MANIGFFDSGLGGLTILKATREMLPQYTYVYYGDTLNLPYGNRSEDEIYELTKRGVKYLFDEGCVLVIIACNTASAETLRRLQDTFLKEQYPDLRILGVIIPTIEALVQSGAKRALMLATKRTVNSKKYPMELRKRNITELQFNAVATPELVPLIEMGDTSAGVEYAISVIKREGSEADTIVLGCTHYCVLKEQLREYFSESKKIISQDEIIPQKLAQYLMRHPEIESQLGRGGGCRVHFTDPTTSYDSPV